jgi:hypothetical protein
MVHAFFPEIKLDVEIQRFLLEIESALRFLFSTAFLCERVRLFKNNERTILKMKQIHFQG